MIDRFERFSVTISEISRYWHKISSDEMEKYGLKGAHSIYLTTLYRYPDGLNAGQLCDLCAKDKADVSRMMGIMERKGLVIKTGGNQSGYKGVFRLTESGREAAEFVKRRAGMAVEKAGYKLDDKTRAAFYIGLELIAEGLKEISKEGLPEEDE